MKLREQALQSTSRAMEGEKSVKRFLSAALGRERYVPPEEAAYLRLARKGYNPAAIIDVGAYQGDWTRLVNRVFPGRPVLMVEAQAGKTPFLDRVCAELPNARYVSSLLTSRAGETVSFFEMETGSSTLPERSNVSRKEMQLTTRTLDDVAGDITGPIFLKIDVQGAELEVLAGGESTLERSELVQLEVALLPYNEGAPTMLDVLAYMDRRDFVPLDISGLTRPNGVDLVQIDLLFTRRGSDLRTTFFKF